MKGVLLPPFRWILLIGILFLVLFQLLQVKKSYKHVNHRLDRSNVFRPLMEPKEDDLAHLNDLNVQCLNYPSSIITSRYRKQPISKENTSMKEIIGEILQCPEVEVFLPLGIRSHGYCEDAMAYVKFLKTRAMPAWVYEMEYHLEGETYSYHDLCPDTAILLMNHYWDGIHEHPSFPSTKKLVLMPNIEMYELKAEHYHRVDYVLAKTKDSYDRITNWYSQENNNPRNTQVYYTMHTSSDPTYLARIESKNNPTFGPIISRDFENLTFFHANGRSAQKNTPEILQCWSEHPEYPPLYMYSNEQTSKNKYWELKENYDLDNVHYHFGEFIDTVDFGKLMAEASVILCPSVMEGFGHYINQARASGAFVLTTNGTPMNEFIDEESGTLVYDIVPRDTQDRVLMGHGTEFHVQHEDICAAIDRILLLTPEERAVRASESHRRYYEQQLYFKDAMRKFRMLLREQLTSAS